MLHWSYAVIWWLHRWNLLCISRIHRNQSCHKSNWMGCWRCYWRRVLGTQKLLGYLLGRSWFRENLHGKQWDAPWDPMPMGYSSWYLDWHEASQYNWIWVEWSNQWSNSLSFPSSYLQPDYRKLRHPWVRVLGRAHWRLPCREIKHWGSATRHWTSSLGKIRCDRSSCCMWLERRR